MPAAMHLPASLGGSGTFCQGRNVEAPKCETPSGCHLGRPGGRPRQRCPVCPGDWGPELGAQLAGTGTPGSLLLSPRGVSVSCGERFHHSLAHSFIRWVQDGNLRGQLRAEGWSRGRTEPRDCVGVHSGYVGTALLLALETGAQGPGASAFCAFWGLRTCFP